MVQVYWGDGKGKTTAAMGQALRAVGAGWRVAVVQFLKDGTSGELAPLSALPGVGPVLHDGAQAKFTSRMTEQEKADSRVLHDANLGRALRQARQAGDAPGSLLVLDEALDALRAGLLDEELLVQAMDWAAGQDACELVITGHCLPECVAGRADYITRMSCEAHPYTRGVAARAGVEY